MQWNDKYETPQLQLKNCNTLQHTATHCNKQRDVTMWKDKYETSQLQLTKSKSTCKEIREKEKLLVR